MLNGKMEYNKNSHFNNFKGFIKLKKDPKGEELNNKNLMYREEQNLNAEWIYGLVVYIGKNSSCNLKKGIKHSTSII